MKAIIIILIILILVLINRVRVYKNKSKIDKNRVIETKEKYFNEMERKYEIIKEREELKRQLKEKGLQSIEDKNKISNLEARNEGLCENLKAYEAIIQRAEQKRNEAIKNAEEAAIIEFKKELKRKIRYANKIPSKTKDEICRKIHQM